MRWRVHRGKVQFNWTEHSSSREFSGCPHPMRRFLVIIIMMAALCALAWGFFVEPFRIEVTHFDVHGPVSQPLKIAHLTDLHTNGLGRRENRLLQLLDAEQPDVIIITGDTLTTGYH